MISNKTRNAVRDQFGSYIKKTNAKPDEAENTKDFMQDDDVAGNIYLGSSSAIDAGDVSVDTDDQTIYLGSEVLEEGVPSLRRGEEVRIAFMRVMTKESGATKPLLLFCMRRDETDTLRFPMMVYEGGSPDKVGMKILEHIFQEWPDATFSYSGYKRHNGVTYLWYEGNLAKTYGLVSGKRDDEIWFPLVSEIANYRKMLSFDIDPTVTTLFLDNPKLLYIADSTGRPYDVPSVGYFGSYYKRIGVTSVLGLRKQSPQASLGPFYYFGTYERAMRYAIWTIDYKPKSIDGVSLTIGEDGKYTRGGIVRFAVFLGKETVFLGRPKDEDDDSDASKRFLDERPDRAERLNMRDTAGKWTKKFDSAGLGSSTLTRPDGKAVRLTPQIVVKDYNQQFPLSYHYVDTSQHIDKENLGDVVIE